MESAAQHYPDIFTAQIVGFGNTLVFVQHPQALQQILRRKQRDLGRIDILSLLMSARVWRENR